MGYDSVEDMIRDEEETFAAAMKDRFPDPKKMKSFNIDEEE